MHTGWNRRCRSDGIDVVAPLHQRGVESVVIDLRAATTAGSATSAVEPSRPPTNSRSNSVSGSRGSEVEDASRRVGRRASAARLPRRACAARTSSVSATAA